MAEPMRLRQLLDAPGAPAANWREIAEEVNAEWEKATTTDQRVALLVVFKATMDIAETVIAPGSLDAFKDARHQHYKAFVLQECMVGTNVCVETLDEVTRREIDAGRMAEDNELRNLAKMSMAAPHMSRAELLALADGSVLLPDEIPSAGGWRRVVGWFRKK
jgi:hypothetical protein